MIHSDLWTRGGKTKFLPNPGHSYRIRWTLLYSSFKDDLFPVCATPLHAHSPIAQDYWFERRFFYSVEFIAVTTTQPSFAYYPNGLGV